jgi:hypothetical protein
MNSRDLSRRSFLVSGAAAAVAAVLPARLAESAQLGFPWFRKLQYIAALGDPRATSGTNAHDWGFWHLDPGPRGVSLSRFDSLKARGVAPAGWKFDSTDWWLEEHGLIMEAPSFPIPAGTYLVTGNRDKDAALTVHPADKNGTQRWSLDSGATLYDVTHLDCRSARYTQSAGATSCSPANAHQASFPVASGAAMPPVGNCHKQDYSVLIVTGMGGDSRT